MVLKSEIHAVYFKNNKYKTIQDALEWIYENNFKPNLLEVKSNGWWVNITPKQKYKKFTVKKIDDDNINLVLGWK